MLCPNCFSHSFDGKTCTACHYEMKEEKCIEDLKLFCLLKGRYMIGRSLGAGGYGITYVAYDKLKDQRVCVKEYFPMGLVIRGQDGMSIQYTRQNRIEEFRHGIGTGSGFCACQREKTCLISDSDKSIILPEQVIRLPYQFFPRRSLHLRGQSDRSLQLVHK